MAAALATVTMETIIDYVIAGCVIDSVVHLSASYNYLTIVLRCIMLLLILIYCLLYMYKASNLRLQCSILVSMYYSTGIKQFV